MSWDKTYSHTLLVGLDRLGAAVLFNEPDITISSLCWIVLKASDPRYVDMGPRVPVADAIASLVKLRLYKWQLRLLWNIGHALERFFPGHCAAAREGDLDTSERSRVLLCKP